MDGRPLTQVELKLSRNDNQQTHVEEIHFLFNQKRVIDYVVLDSKPYHLDMDNRCIKFGTYSYLFSRHITSTGEFVVTNMTFKNFSKLLMRCSVDAEFVSHMDDAMEMAEIRTILDALYG